jgi:WD40 repeat protein/DNA-binding SARP family transcriptional activator
MQINLLGTVEVSSDNGRVVLGGPKPRALLAMLALDAGSTVPAERLIEGLWGEEPPPTAAKMVQVYVSQLRKAMAAHGEDDAIATSGRGYQLQLGRERVDACRVERLLAHGAAREALRLWRGPALADVAEEPFAAAEIRRLEELRASALEVAIDHDLDAGRHREVLPELEALLAQEPLRERLHAQRMLALYRSGRQADALEAYRGARAMLVEQIGVEPGPDLRRMHEAILRQDPSLDPPRREPAGAPLVGRDAELAHLRELWRRARAGTGASVVITGPPGIGKTRLLRELAEEVRRDGGAVAYGEPEEVHGPTLLVLDDVAQAPELPPDEPVLAVATAVDGEGETLPLAPLGRDEVAALARYHAGARAVVEPPVDRLLAESGGVPARVHQAAAAWARAVATRRVGEAAARAAAESAVWHLAGDDVAAEVVELQTMRERAQLAGSEAMPACPFKGLASFEVEDAPVFFGREQLVADMIARLTGTRLLGIIGPSGSGKSSAMRAGLLAALADGVLPGSERWPQALFRPGAQPLAALERATAELPAHERWIVAVDQFEETFTTCRDAAERAAFVDALVACARDTRRRTLVLVAVRADFYGHCAQFSELSRLLGANQVLVGPMRRHELRRAIELPARRAGLQVDPELVDALLGDVEGEPGGLPLLSTALLELWQQRDDRRLTVRAYERSGGVRGAVARLAEGAYERLDGAQREAARRIFLRLAGDGGVRVRVPCGELPGDVHDLLSVLASDRLITIGDGEVEVAHEALLREWPRLRAWLDEDADGRRVQRHLTEAARGWDAGGRDPGELYRGARLASALEWRSGHAADLNATERAFLAHSRAAGQRSQRRLRAVLAGVAALLVLSAFAGLVALGQRSTARDRATAADALRLGSRALAETDLERALLLARQGVALDDTVQTRGNLLAALMKIPAAVGILPSDGEAIATVELSPDERTLAAGTSSNKVLLFDTRTSERLATLEPTSGYAFIGDLAFSPDGVHLAVAYDGPGATLAVFDIRERRVVARTDPRPGRIISGLGFSPDGRAVDAIVARVVPFATPGPAELVRIDALTGDLRLGPVPINGAGMTSHMITSDGRRLVAVGEQQTVLRDAESLRALTTWPVGGRDVSAFWPTALAPDDRTVAIGGADGSIRFLDLESGEQRKARGVHAAEVLGASFTPDGRTLVTTGADSDVILWDARGATMREVLPGQAGRVLSPQVTRDGSTLYTAGPGSAAFVWDLAGTRRLARPFVTGPPASERSVFEQLASPMLALSSDGRLIAGGRDDGAIGIVDARTLAPTTAFAAVSSGPVAGLAFVPGTHRLVVSGTRGFLAVADADRGRLISRLPGHSGDVLPPAISADGRLLVTGGGDRTVRLWSLPEARTLGAPLQLDRVPSNVQVSPDGRRLAIVLGHRYSNSEAALEVWDSHTRARIARLAIPDAPTAVHFSPDGRLLAVGYPNGRLQLWSTDSWKPMSRLLAGDTGDIYALAISPDSGILATGSSDRTVRLWDIETQQPIGAPLAGPGRGVGGVAPYFTPDGWGLIASYDTGIAYRWDIRPESLARHACRVAGRRLTRQEWKEFLPGRAYDPAC